MSTTIRSATARLDADVASYVAKMRLAGRETDKAFANAPGQIRAVNRELAITEKRLTASTKATQLQSTAYARLATRTDRLQTSTDKLNLSLDRTQPTLRASGDELDAVVDTARRASREFDNGGASIDRYSGRLGILLKAAAVAGPALVPLIAGSVPALAGATAGLGALGGALGVTLLASAGLGDGLKALREYGLDPTAANAEKLQQELDRLGPAGEHFVRFLDSITPELKTLQNAARAGFLPGVEDGIDALLTKLPQGRRVIREIATEMGDIARGSGQALAGPRFEAFFDYLDDRAAPILDDLATSAGNLFETLANLLVGVDPATDSFLTGLVNKTGDLAAWSRNLDESEGFQNFLDYAIEKGPQVVDFLGSTVGLLAAIGQAAAPVGDIVLPILTGILDATTALARSDLGTPIFATLAAMSALSATTKAWGAVSQTTVAQIVTGQASATKSTDKTRASLVGLGKSAAATGGIVLLTAAVNELAAANDEMEASATRARDALDRGDRSAARQNITDLEDQTDALEALVRVAATSNDPVESFLANFNPGVFANNVKDLFGESEIETRRQEIEDYRYALETLDTSNPYTSLALLDPILADNAAAFGRAAAAADDYAGTLADVNKVVSERQAWRDVEEALDDATASIKENGKHWRRFGPEGRANQVALERFASSSLTAAQTLKGVGRQLNYIDGQRKVFLRLADSMGMPPKLARQLATQLGLLPKEVKPKVNLDTSSAKQREAEIQRLLRKLGLKRTSPEIGMEYAMFVEGDRIVLGRLRELDRKKASPTVTANTSGALSAINAVRAALAGVQSKTVTLTTLRVTRGGGAPARSDIPLPGSADGSTVPKSGLGYADRYIYALADGEEITSNRHGQADTFRPELKDINAGLSRDEVWRRMEARGLADGGTAMRRWARVSESVAAARSGDRAASLEAVRAGRTGASQVAVGFAGPIEVQGWLDTDWGPARFTAMAEDAAVRVLDGEADFTRYHRRGGD